MCQMFSDVKQITNLRISSLILKIEVLEISILRVIFSLSELYSIFFISL